MATNNKFIIKEQFRLLRRYFAAFVAIVLVVQAALFAGIISGIWGEGVEQWIWEFSIAAISMLAVLASAIFASWTVERRVQEGVQSSVDRELRDLRAASKQIRSVQDMTSALSARLSTERVLEITMDVCVDILGDLGIPANARVGATYLIEENELAAVATYHLVDKDYERRLPARAGVVGQVMDEVEAVISVAPAEDPELSQIVAFKESATVLCLPIRSGFHLYGLIALGSGVPFRFSEREVTLFSAVADQAVAAMKNAERYQELLEDKKEIIALGEVGLRSLARALYEGPKQDVDSMAMRLSFVRSTVITQPEKAEKELRKVEAMGRKTSKDIQHILNSLRPAELTARNLSDSINALVEKLHERHGLKLLFSGIRHGALLDDAAQGTALYVIEEAVKNAYRFGGANIIEISLWPEDKWFMARVADNGTQIEAQVKNGSMKESERLVLANMQLRAKQIDGRLEIASEPGRGSSVTLVIPMEKHGRHTVISG